MSTRKQSSANHNKIKPIALILALFVICLAVIVVYHFTRHTAPLSGNNPQKDDNLIEKDILRLSEENYTSVFLTMHSAESFHEEDFTTFRGLDTVIASHAILDTKELSQYLDCILSSGNAITNLYLCLDPELLWANARERVNLWNSSLTANLYSYIEEYPDISFEILLPYPYIDYWLELTDKDLETILTLYHTFINDLSVYPNVKIFFPGIEYWLMVNPDNYRDNFFDANEVITQKLFLYTFCDSVYQITPTNEEFFWNSLRETIEREKNTPTVYPDLSDWCLVFFGDSVLANADGSYSIPGYITGLSKCLAYNYAAGGTSATSYFSVSVNKFLSENVTSSVSGSLFCPDGSPIDKKMCFVINYGFNDYFTGCLVENPQDPDDPASYKGSLRSCITLLQSSFPDAEYIIMSPTHTAEFNNGTAVNSEKGGTLSAYVEAAEELADEMELYFIDNYNNFSITDETLAKYLEDGTHPNELGRFTIAARLMFFIEETLKQ